MILWLEYLIYLSFEIIILSTANVICGFLAYITIQDYE
jgi:hypothetical protein